MWKRKKEIKRDFSKFRDEYVSVFHPGAVNAQE
jgi:hypothetical protein